MMNNQKYYLPPQDEEYICRLEKVYPEKIEQKLKGYSITIQITEDCCMSCTYCYQHHKTHNKMTWETAKVFIDKLLNDKFELINTKNCFAIIFDFIGGEPLMEIDLIDKICEYTIDQMIKLKHPWLYYLRFSICSNGLLYNTPKVQKFFKKYQTICSFTISIDGNKELHDSCRVDNFNNPTYDRVLDMIHLYQSQYKELPHNKMTLSPDNISYTFSALTNLIEEGYNIIPFNCIFEEGWDYSHAKILYNELKKTADYLITNNLYNKIYIKMFNENNFQPMNISENNNYCGGTDMRTMGLNHLGNIYPCLRYMQSSVGKEKEITVGNIYTGFNNTQQEKENLALISNITRRSQSTDECFYCSIARGCAWCSAYNYEQFGTPNKRTTYHCCMHKATSLANVYYWNTLYKYLNIDKQFKMYLLKEEALKIIDEEEYNYLLELSGE